MKIFFQAPSADITTPDALISVISNDENTINIISSNVADFIKTFLKFGNAPQLANCTFGFDGEEWFTVDKKGLVSTVADAAELAAQRETTLTNTMLKKHGVDGLSFVDGVLKLKQLNEKQLQEAITDIFDTDVKINVVIERTDDDTSSKKGKVQKVAMMSLDDFKEVAGVIQAAIQEKTFADLAYLAEHVNADKLKSSEYKFAYRTFYKGLLGHSYPARKPETITDSHMSDLQARYDEMTKNGIEAAYQKIAKAVEANPDRAIKDFFI